MTPLYLTQVLLDYDTAYKAGLRDTYAWHRKIWQAFPGRDGASRDFLTRMDPLDQQMRLLVLSQTPPERPKWCPESGWQSKEVPTGFLDGSAYRFSLVANPTRKVRAFTADGARAKQGKRQFITHREDRPGPDGKPHGGLLSWLARKAETGGFLLPDLPGVRTIPRPRAFFNKGGKLGLHGGVEFQGHLRVTDPGKFREAVVHGLGSAKAFGFGMLVLDPLD